MSRWLPLGLVATALIGAGWFIWRPSPHTIPPEPNPVAAAFVARYIDHDGRVADTANADISHSEGQGYGLLLAEAAGDRDSFDAVLDWTETNLAVREDNLFSWRWDPATGAVTDPNNATDGEILIAWALLRAHDRWRAPRYRARALEILDAVESTLIRNSALGPVFLPGEYGFEDEGSITLNLSYLVFPAFERFSAERRPIWTDISDAGYRIATQAAFGDHQLATDWITINSDGRISPAGNWPPEFGYNAVRIPLHVCWSSPSAANVAARKLILDRYVAFWSEVPPQSIDRWDVSLDRPAGGQAPAGYPAIASLTANCSNAPMADPAVPTIDASEAYYSAALKGLVSIAMQDRAQPHK